MGLCLIPSIGSGLRNAGRFEDGRSDVDDVMELAADASRIVDMARRGHDDALGGPAEMRRHLLHPLERGVHRPRPRRGKMREGPVRAPERVPEVLSLHRHRHAIEGRELVGRTVDHAFGARAVVTADIDDQGVVEFSEVFYRLDDPTDLVVGVSEVSTIDVGLLDEELLLLELSESHCGNFFGHGVSLCFRA